MMAMMAIAERLNDIDDAIEVACSHDAIEVVSLVASRNAFVCVCVCSCRSHLRQRRSLLRRGLLRGLLLRALLGLLHGLRLGRLLGRLLRCLGHGER